MSIWGFPCDARFGHTLVPINNIVVACCYVRLHCYGRRLSRLGLLLVPRSLPAFDVCSRTLVRFGVFMFASRFRPCTVLGCLCSLRGSALVPCLGPSLLRRCPPRSKRDSWSLELRIAAIAAALPPAATAPPPGSGSAAAATCLPRAPAASSADLCRVAHLGPASGAPPPAAVPKQAHATPAPISSERRADAPVLKKTRRGNAANALAELEARGVASLVQVLEDDRSAQSSKGDKLRGRLVYASKLSTSKPGLLPPSREARGQSVSVVNSPSVRPHAGCRVHTLCRFLTQTNLQFARPKCNNGSTSSGRLCLKVKWVGWVWCTVRLFIVTVTGSDPTFTLRQKCNKQKSTTQC